MPQRIFFTPGPSQLFYSVPFHLQVAIRQDIPSISHRSSTFKRLFAETKHHLTELLGLPPGYHIFFTGSATEIWERILQNVVTNSSHHFVNGAFSRRFYEYACQYQFDSSISEADEGQGWHSWPSTRSCNLISVTINETSTGFTIPQEELTALREAHPDTLISADVVSLSPAVSFDMSQVDTAYLSVQKCFGLPAGLGIWVVNDRMIETARQKASAGGLVGTYHALESLKKYGDKDQTPETPNVLGLFLLNAVAKDMLERGVTQIRNETTYKAALLYGLFEEKKMFEPLVPEKKHRSKTVCVAEVDGGSRPLIDFLESKGLIVGSGYGAQKETHIRIANFPTHSKEQIELLVDSISSF